ncbi:CD27 antigen [Kryptolebias marmoratus]|uniref:CD27 antigen n=1 Tax=Kryptolebias marmoratus TaxID=37003 RepID=UPI0007F8ADFB|nr:CD27 antigen [Kryptolebias marmoratus]
MQPFCYFTFSLLCSLLGLSISCHSNEYAWPTGTEKLCCPKCSPGSYMDSRSETICDIKCNPCTGERYMDDYNTEMSCNICDSCNEPNFVTESSCNSTSNTVCKCKAGYKFKDESRTKCVPIPTTTKPTSPPGTTATSRAPAKPNKEPMWFLVVIVILCAGITLVILTKIKSFLHWIRSNHGYFLAEKASTEPSCAEDEDVSKPVQEVCGKCDQPIDV